jgi:predicted nucleic acid-binding Zn ribbon protein
VQIGLGVHYIWPRKSEQDNWENWAVLWLIGHAAMNSSGRSPGLILRFKHCLQCGVWFYAVTEHQKHCSTRCRKKFHSESPEFRKKRADYMRNTYRPSEKAKEEKSREWSEKRGFKKRSVKHEYL